MISLVRVQKSRYYLLYLVLLEFLAAKMFLIFLKGDMNIRRVEVTEFFYISGLELALNFKSLLRY